MVSSTNTFSFMGGYTFITSLRACCNTIRKSKQPRGMAVMVWSGSATHPSQRTRCWCSKKPHSPKEPTADLGEPPKGQSEANRPPPLKLNEDYTARIRVSQGGKGCGRNMCVSLRRSTPVDCSLLLGKGRPKSAQYANCGRKEEIGDSSVPKRRARTVLPGTPLARTTLQWQHM